MFLGLVNEKVNFRKTINGGAVMVKNLHVIPHDCLSIHFKLTFKYIIKLSLIISPMANGVTFYQTGTFKVKTEDPSLPQPHKILIFYTAGTLQ